MVGVDKRHFTYVGTCHNILRYIGYFATSVDTSEVSKCYTYPAEDSKNYYCFYTDGSVLSLNDTREFCESRNATLPTLTDAVTDLLFQQFTFKDSFNVTRNRSVWIDAYARVNRPNDADWRWINGRTSGTVTVIFPRY